MVCIALILTPLQNRWLCLNGKQSHLNTQKRRGSVAAAKNYVKPVKQLFLVVCLLWSFVVTTGVRAGGRDVAGSQRTREAYPISVDYDRTVLEMVSVGRYDYANPNVSDDNFPAQRGERQELIVYLFHTERVMSSDEIAGSLDKEGLRPATLRELLSFGSTYPDAQRTMDIVALAPRWRDKDGYYKVPCLYTDSGNRLLGLLRADLKWDAGTQVASVSK
jgi:hypothetical protein